VLFWLAHAIDDFFVIPVAERRIVRLPPALTIATQLVLGLASGALGIMMAAPFVAVAIVVIRRLVVEDVIEREPGPAADSVSLLRLEKADAS
jgi:predicted PurR-regulated permease PerM